MSQSDVSCPHLTCAKPAKHEAAPSWAGPGRRRRCADTRLDLPHPTASDSPLAPATPSCGGQQATFGSLPMQTQHADSMRLRQLLGLLLSLCDPELSMCRRGQYIRAAQCLSPAPRPAASGAVPPGCRGPAHRGSPERAPPQVQPAKSAQVRPPLRPLARDHHQQARQPRRLCLRLHRHACRLHNREYSLHVAAPSRPRSRGEVISCNIVTGGSLRHPTPKLSFAHSHRLPQRQMFRRHLQQQCQHRSADKSNV